MKIKISQILEDFAGTGLLGDLSGPDAVIERIYTVEDCRPGDLVFVENQQYLAAVKAGRPAAAVAPAELKDQLTADGITVITSPNVKLAHALLKQRYADRDLGFDQWDRVHPTAVIHPSAKVPESCFVGPHVVIGRDVEIGENCRLQAGAAIEHSVRMGNGCLIFANAVVGYGTVIGNEVEIGAGTVIGAEGFGFAQDEKRQSHRLPQTGYVKIEDRVRLGANNTVDRAAYGVTRIGAGTKTDNLCHIGHGVDIGKDCLMAAGFGVAGSTVIGDRVMASGQTGILDHLTIPSDTVLVHRCAVVQSIDKPGIYAGNPAQPLKEYLKNTATFRHLYEMAKKLRLLEKKTKDLTADE